MKLRREAKTLLGKAIASLRRGLSAFNSFDDDGRQTAVHLHLQHSCEMLLKALLVQKRMRVFDPQSSRSIGFDRCVGQARAHHGLTDAEAWRFRRPAHQATAST